jgi:putative chitinase
MANALGSARLVAEPELANDPKIAGRSGSVPEGQAKRCEIRTPGQGLATARKVVNGGSHGFERFAAAFNAGAQLLARADCRWRRLAALRRVMS